MKIKIRNFFIFSALAFLATSCVTTNQMTKDANMAEAAHDLERVEESQTYSGKIAISDLIFVANKGQFNVNYNEDASNYVQAARVNISGDASSSVQMALFLAAQGQASFTAPVSLGSAPGSNGPASPTNPLPNQAETAVNGFTAPTPLSGTPTDDERDAVEKGINDKLAEQFLKFMANPNPNIDTNTEAIVFAVMQATCEPGQRTREGFIAEMDIITKYARQKPIKVYSANPNFQSGIEGFNKDTGQMFKTDLVSTNAIVANQTNILYLVGTNTDTEIQQNSRPGVLAVLPLMDSRNMELQNNNQSQVEIAAALSAAFAAKGATAAANILSDYVKRQQSNIQTFNSLPVTVAYANRTDFGFQLYPAAEALENPGESGPAAKVLEPVTFPIVVALKVEKSDLEGTDTNAPWNLLTMETHAHWIPIKWGYWHKRWLYDITQAEWPFNWWEDSSYDFLAYQPDYQLEYRASLLDDARRCLNIVAPDGMTHPLTIPPQYSLQYLQLEEAYDSLRTSAVGVETARPLPDMKELFPTDQTDTNAPTITDVFPHTIWRNTNTQFVILVKGVKNTNDIQDVMIAGVSCSNLTYFPYGYTNYTRAITYNTTNTIISTNLVYTKDIASGALVGQPAFSVATNTYITNYVGDVVASFASAGVAIEATLPNMFYSITNTATNNIDFVVLFKYNNLPPATKTVGMLLQGKSQPQAGVTIARDINGKVLGINIQPTREVPGTNLLNATRDVLRKSEPPPKTVNIIH